MNFIFSMILAIIFVWICEKQLRKNPVPFYIVVGIISAAVAICQWMEVSFPDWFSTWIWPIFSRAGFSTALFIIVMITGALPNGSKGIKFLMPVRGQLSILACMLTLAHNIGYGKTYFRFLFTMPSVLPKNQLAAAICSVIMILIMLPLFVTSFITVRKKMDAKTWKKLQRLAYGFYALVYCHVMLLTVPYAASGRSGYRFTVFIYSAVFISYAVIRVMKYLAVKNKNAEGLVKKQIIGGCCGVIAAAVVLICVSVSGKADAVESPDENDYSLSETEDMFYDGTETEELIENEDDQYLPDPMDYVETDQVEAEPEPEINELSEDDEDEESDAVNMAQQEETAVGTENKSESDQNSKSEVDTTENLNFSAKEVSETSEEQTQTSAAESEPEVEPEPEPEPEIEPEPEPEPAYVYKNGTFTGSGNGYGGTITVSVTINNDVITSISIVSANDDEPFFSLGKGVIDRILSAQSTDVDTVSGATLTSSGIISAVKSALASAKN